MNDARFSACLWTLLIFLLLTGYHLRATRLDEFPPGLSNDEADNLVDGAILSRSGRMPFFQDHNRPEPLVRIYFAVASRFFGDTIWAYRYMSLLWGMLSLAAIYWSSQQCFAEQPLRARRLIGLLALASLAVALGHIALNRTLYRAVSLVVFVTLAAGFTCRALHRQRSRDYIFSGICLALGCYTYTAGLAVPLAYLPLVVQLAIFRRRDWRHWLLGLTATALVLFVLTLPISYLLLTQPEAILTRARDVVDTGQTDWLARLQDMVAHFLIRGDQNPQYNVAGAPLVSPAFMPFFLAGLAALAFELRRPASTFILSLLLVCALPALLTSVTNGVRIHVVFALLPLVIGASVMLPFRLFARFSGLTRLLPLACLAAIAALGLYAAIEARRIYAEYWLRAGADWQTWRRYDLELSHSEWFFRTDKKFLADWITAQDRPLLIPLSELEVPPLRAMLMAAFPSVEPMPAGFDLPPQTPIIVPWALKRGATFLKQTARLALLRDNTIIVLPPLTDDDRLLALSNTAGATELIMPASNYPAVARIQQLPPAWAPQFESSASSNLLARFNGELELRGYDGPNTIKGPGPLDFVLEWSVARPVSHEYGAFLQLLSPDWQVIASQDQHFWRYLYPTVVWPPEQTFSQLFTLSINEQLPPGAYRLVAGAWYVNSDDLPAESFVGHATDGIATIGWVKVAQAQPPVVPQGALPLSHEFGGLFRLRHIVLDREDDVTFVDLYWTALQSRPPANASIFLHALDDQGALVSQSDILPWDGRYPTFIWDAGETVTTNHRLQIPRADGVELVVGMYTLPDAARLIARSNGERHVDDIVRLGAVTDLLARQDN